jgi:vacuolar-type H+-ATPase subunit D/Vma8
MVQNGDKRPTKIILLKFKIIMNTVNGYKNVFEKKKQHLFIRMDDSMIDKLKEIRRKTGISISETIRESIRRLLQEVDATGSINLKINN